MIQKEVIVVTDGDSIARKAIEIATQNIGGRCISISSGNPTTKTGYEILEIIQTALHNPVVIMVDDCGNKGAGKGETALETIMESNDIKILGVIAVASNDCDESGISVNFSIDKNGEKISSAVDKFGNIKMDNQIYGDTVSVLNKFMPRIPVIVGIGDPGKMDRNDDAQIGSPITTLALKEIVNFNRN